MMYLRALARSSTPGTYLFTTVTSPVKEERRRPAETGSDHHSRPVRAAEVREYGAYDAV